MKHQIKYFRFIDPNQHFIIQGVSVDNLNTPPSPQYVPPFTIFAPWCFRALLLPDTYQRGRMYALRLLCLVTIRPQVSFFAFFRDNHNSLKISKVTNKILLYNFGY